MILLYHTTKKRNIIPTDPSNPNQNQLQPPQGSPTRCSLALGIGPHGVASIVVSPLCGLVALAIGININARPLRRRARRVDCGDATPALCVPVEAGKFVVHVVTVEGIADQRGVTRLLMATGQALTRVGRRVRISKLVYRIADYVRTVLEAAHLDFLLAVVSVVLHLDLERQVRESGKIQ